MHCHTLHIYALGEVFPSRYSLAFEAIRFDQVQCAFVSLDPERIGENLNDDFTQDFGDNKFPHFNGTKSFEDSYLEALREEQSDDSDDEDNLTSIPHIPDCISQFLDLKVNIFS